MPDTRSYPDQDSLLAPSLEKLAEVVAMIPNTSQHFGHYDDYIKMAIAIYAATDGEGERIFEEWASRWEGGNDPPRVAADWATLFPPFAIGGPTYRVSQPAWAATTPSKTIPLWNNCSS